MMTAHISNLISEIARLNTEINIKVNNYVKELDELRLKQDRMRNDFYMSRECFDVALHLKCKICRD